MFAARNAAAREAHSPPPRSGQGFTRVNGPAPASLRFRRGTAWLHSACWVMVALSLPDFAPLADSREEPPRHPEERVGAATLIHRADVIRDRATNSAAPMRLWPLYATADARMNYVEVAGRSALHFHPDADHKLYVLEGRVTVIAGTNSTTAIAGDLIIIPRGVRHCYDVPAKGERALLLTFDAPPYDPSKTVQLETTAAAAKNPAHTTNP